MISFSRIISTLFYTIHQVIIASQHTLHTRCAEEENGVLAEYRQTKNAVVAETRNEHIY